MGRVMEGKSARSEYLYRLSDHSLHTRYPGLTPAAMACPWNRNCAPMVFPPTGGRADASGRLSPPRWSDNGHGRRHSSARSPLGNSRWPSPVDSRVGAADAVCGSLFAVSRRRVEPLSWAGPLWLGGVPLSDSGFPGRTPHRLSCWLPGLQSPGQHPPGGASH